MKHRRTFETLLAVSLATTPAVAGPRHGRDDGPSAAGPRESHVVARVAQALAAIVGATQAASPRAFPSGAPACGNVATRAMPRPCERAPQPQLQVATTSPAPSRAVSVRTRR